MRSPDRQMKEVRFEVAHLLGCWWSRGAVLVETVLVIGTALTLMIFAIDVGVFGFLQESADAAGFIYAHGETIPVNNAAGPAAAMHAVFPQILASDASGAPAAAATPSIPVDYLYNGTAAEQLTSADHRRGGAAVIQPVHYVTTIAHTTARGYNGLSVGITTQNTEPFWRECGAHFDIANVTTACGSATDPANYNVNYFQNGENTPPYFVGFDYLYFCRNKFQWWVHGWTTCDTPPSQQWIWALPIASNLSAPYTRAQDPAYQSQGGTWDKTVPGVSGQVYYSSESSFLAAACHQRFLSYLSNFMLHYRSLGSIYADWLLPSTTNPAAYPGSGTSYPGVGLGHYGLRNWWINGSDFAEAHLNNRVFDDISNAAWDQIFNDATGVTVGYAPATYTALGQFTTSSRGNCEVSWFM